MDTVVARLDVTTWQLHDAPPAAVDAHTDRQADHCFTLGQTAAWTTSLCCVAFPFAPLHWGLGALVATGIALLAWRGHRRLRRRTGLPVVAELHDLFEAYTVLLECDEGMVRTIRETNPDPAAQGEADEFEAAVAEEKRLLARELMLRCELAAQAQRRGWRWLHNRHVRYLHARVVPFLKRLSIYVPPDAEQTADGTEDAVPPTSSDRCTGE